MLPLEAQACGTPVIAYGKGGALETVRGLDQTDPTGIFFAEQSVRSICQAIKIFEDNQEKITSVNCAQQANKFSPGQFKKIFQTFIDEKLEQAKAIRAY